MAKLHQIERLKMPIAGPKNDSQLFDDCYAWHHYAYLKQIWLSLSLSYLNDLPQGLVHGDFSYTNLIINDHGIITLIDFDYLQDDYLLNDIVKAQHSLDLTSKGIFVKVINSFISEYQKLRPLTTVEKNNILIHLKKSLIETAFKMYFYMYVNRNGPLKGVLGNPELVDRVLNNPQNYYLDPEHIVQELRSLESIDQLLFCD